MPKKHFWMAVLMLVFAAGLTGCGKKGALEPPPGADSKYPREFPAR